MWAIPAWVEQILLAVIGLSGGVAVAAGLFSFIVELGVVADFADRTHTGEQIMFYEDCVALGGIMGNLIYVFRIGLPLGTPFLAVTGLFAGIFVGCWAMALADILNVFPIFIRRLKIIKTIPYIIIGLSLGKTAGALVYFLGRWGV